MKKLALTAATAAALLCTGFAPSNQARAQDQGYPQPQPYVSPVIGEGGAHWGNQCWVETWGGGTSYFGYWKACNPPKTAKH